MTRVDLDVLGQDRTGRLFATPDQVKALVAELRAAREVIKALHDWEAMDGHFFGHTPAEGGDVGRALMTYEQGMKP
jgi:hypothetical protein